MRTFYHCAVCIIMIDAEKIDQSWSTYSLSRRRRMPTLDEITKEKQRIGEALQRVDTQREKLISQLRELEATERVLARHTKGVQPRKTASAKMRTTATEAAAPARSCGRRRTSMIGSLRGQRARRSSKSPQRARGFAQTASAPPLPDTSALAALKSVTGRSTPDSRRGQRNLPRSDPG